MEILKNIRFISVWYRRVVKIGKFTAAGRTKLVIYTDRSSVEEEDLHVDVNCERDKPIGLLAID